MTYRHVRNVRSFFSDYYLGSVFHRGEGRGRRRKLSDRDTDLAYARFQRIHERAEDKSDDPAKCRENFLRPFLRDVLGFHLGAGADRIHGLFASADDEAAGKKPLAVVWCGGWDENLDSSPGSQPPQRRLEAALDAAGVLYGFLGTGERFRLVRAPGEGPRHAYLEADLTGLAEEQDSESFALFYHLAHATQFVPDADGNTAIHHIEEESRKQAERVSEDLKRAVFSATETLVGALLDDARRRGVVSDLAALCDSDLLAYRDAGLTAIYRLLFILYAEARDVRLLDNGVYLEGYSLERTIGDLLNDPTREWPANRSRLWSRLRALFKVYDVGLERISPWEHIPPRGGNFFDASTPAGKLLDDARLVDRDVATLLLALSTTSARRGVGFERVSFRELDIESLGSVYEGLLEFEPRVARETTIEVKAAGRVFALAPTELVRLCREKSLDLRGDLEIVTGTAAESLHPDAPSDDEEDETDVEDDDEPSEDSSDDEEAEGVKKGSTARLQRRFEPGSFHFVPGVARKGSGSFYTPRLLVQDIVRHALGPLVEGRTSTEIERLRVLDPACGSAHFLVEAMRFLGVALHRAYSLELHGLAPADFRNTTGQGWDDAWNVPDEEARAANSEARAWCKRRIAERCLFGVDLNGTAVELARVALWIESLAGDRPLSYFHHHIRHGNSLLGTWMDRLDAPPLAAMTPKAAAKSTETLFGQLLRQRVLEAAKIRRLIDEITPDALRAEGSEPESVDEFRFKERQHKRADEILAAAQLLFDLRSASAFVPGIWGEWSTLYSFVDDFAKLSAYARSRAWWAAFEAVRNRERFFHWELEFPEVLLGDRGGFDTVIGNPPWDKVLPSKHEFYARADVLIRAFKGNELDRRIAELHRERVGLKDAFDAYTEATMTRAKMLRQGGDFPLNEARSQAAHEDVSKYFVDRSARLVAECGRVGLVVPSGLHNGDGCVGVRRFLVTAARIERFYGFENRQRHFPIHASYKFVSLVFRKGDPGDGSFDAAFMRHDLNELVFKSPMPWIVRMTRDEIVNLSPDTLTFLEFRSARDQRIALRMHHGRPVLGGEGPDSWGVTFLSWRAHDPIFNVSEDRDLFTDKHSGVAYTPESVLNRTENGPTEVIARMAQAGMLPMLGCKEVDQFLLGTKAPRRWLNVASARAKYGTEPRRGIKIVFRDQARNTDERTCIAAVLPTGVAASHTLSALDVNAVSPEAATAVLNSFAFDWALRLRVAGMHVSATYILPVPVPPASETNRLPRIQTRFAWDAGVTHIADNESVWPDLWAVNRAVAEAYDLTPDDFEHIVASFPGMAKKRPAFVAYIHTRLAEWRAEYPATALDAGALRVAETP